ncbi:Early growth response protein 1-B [Fusarium odoratissimum]|uniref:Early growth response protein 1-B n=1 Tax=Fusarium oxysporum f. sp. cubense (strain race 4) TaxID=2502994 RepID=N1RA02_FUSC4|nr:Early growth response protein 1-B [Fusarium odoratissimum]
MNRLYELADEFRRSLRTHHEEEFENTTIEDMRKEIHDIQLLRDKTNNMMDMNRLRMFLGGMEELEKVLLRLQFPGTTGVMSIVWGSVRFLLRSTNTTDRAFDGVLDVYGLLGAQLLPLTRFEEFFQRFPFAIECIVNIYHDIQRFHSIAYRLFSLTTKLWQRLQRPIWDDASHLFSRLSDFLGSHAKFIKEHSPSTQDYDALHAAFQQYSYGLKSDWKNFEADEKARRLGRKYEVTEWIASSPKMPRLQDEFRDMVICPKSGRWLFRNYSDISEWMGEESAIWLHGNVGYGNYSLGKTVLASLIVDELKSSKLQNTMPSFPEASKTCYFYCQEDDIEHRNHLDILKGILLQMVEAEDYIIPFCYQEKVTSGGSNLIDAKLAQKLIKTFVEFSVRHYILIDGLDECEGAEIQQTAQFFKDLVSTYDTQIRLGHLRVLFIGRETSDTKKHIPGDDCISIALRPEDNHDDIRAFVQKKLPDFSKSSHGIGFSLSEADKADVERIICHQSQDSFLYAHLAIEFLLQQDTKGDLLTLLRQGILPTKLGDMYERLLDSVKKSLVAQPGGSVRWERSKLLFGWLICAKRPLRWHEMQAILCFDPIQLKIDFENDMLRQDMEKYLGSIVHVLDGGHIRLIHSTARRYLTLPCFTWDDNYLSHQRSQDAKLGWFSFQDYACSQWLYHVDTLIRECSEIFAAENSSDVAADFAYALKHFVNTHRVDLTTTKHFELVETHIETFMDLELYEDLHWLWNHIYTHQRGDYTTKNTVGVKQIENGLKDNRTELERFPSSQRSGDEDTIEDYYGSNLFKCNRTLCRFFYVGYDKKSARDDHGRRHERPFHCPMSCNAAPLGFMSNKDRDRHINIYHPELSEGPPIFETLSRRQASGGFVCKICNKTFTRNINLKSHERSHFGDRPFACATCGKAFARVNDCRRHEKIHARRGY